MTTEARRDPFERSIGDVLSDLFRDGSELIRQEIELAKVEMRENVSSLTKDSVGIAIGGAMALVGLFALVAALILVLGLVMPYWASALIVGGLLVIIGMVVVMANVRAIKSNGIAPKKTMETIKEDARMVREKFA
ncbi:MAG TPA: phage holin family protein [Trueperaceae bacterium]